MNPPKLFVLSIVDPQDKKVNWIEPPNLDSAEILDLSLRENLSLYISRIQLIANGLKKLSNFSENFILSNNYETCIKYKDVGPFNTHFELEGGTYYICKSSEELFELNNIKNIEIN